MTVFINCPFDEAYTPLLRGIIFSFLRFGIDTSIALDDTNCISNRLDKIVAGILSSDISVHDLSRIKSKKKNEYYRLNMPFELGVDYGAELARKRGKKILVLEDAKYSYQKGLSDCSGIDVFTHKHKPEILVRIIRDWLVNNGLTSIRIAAGRVWSEYLSCWAYIYEKLIARGYSEAETRDIPINEYRELVEKWMRDELSKT